MALQKVPCFSHKYLEELVLLHRVVASEPIDGLKHIRLQDAKTETIRLRAFFFPKIHVCPKLVLVKAALERFFKLNCPSG
jgi:hypothetical protein